jgi:lipopolysaccharide transport system ATP-binding protein
MKSAIKVSSLSKQYQIGSEIIRGQSFREMLSGVFSYPFSRYKNLKQSDPSAERIWALKDVSFEVDRGEILGIVGKNGAGKSTLLKVLSRVTTPTSGEISYRGKLAALLEVGTGFHPELTGRENVFLNGTILGMSRKEIKAKLDRIVEFAEVEGFLDTPVKRYSSGMLVRLAFSVSAHIEPDILIVDEVLAVGDIAFQKKCIEQLQKLTRSGCTVLIVSHNMATVQALADRCLLLESGTIIARGATQEVVESYLKRYGEEYGIVVEDSHHARLIEFSGSTKNTGDREILITIQVIIEFLMLTKDVRIDFGIENINGQRIIHYVDTNLDRKDIKANETMNVSYSMQCTQLLPGEYFGVLYVYSKSNGVLLHLEEVSLFSVPRTEDLVETFSNSFTPVIVPNIKSSVAVV